jgi:predicted Zn-dependent protease
MLAGCVGVLDLAPMVKQKLTARSRTPASVLIAAVCLAGLALGGCTANPATGGSDFTPLMSPQKERELGAQEHGKVLRKFGVYGDPALASYITRLGASLVGHSEMSDRPFKFTVLDSATVNAFALPGGYVYITRGLLALANSEAQLVSVLGHEIGHVTARHSAQRYNRAAEAGFVSSVFGKILGSGAKNFADFVGKSYVASYSRDQEYEADKLGIRYMARANYDPRAASRFLGAMRSTGGADKMGKKSLFGDLQASHPNTAERVARAAKTARQKIGETPRLAHGRIGRRSFLRRLDGLPFGNSHAQGIIAKGVYLHKGRRVKARVPLGLKYQVMPGGFIAGNGQGLYLSVDMKSRAGSNDPFRYLTTGWGRDLSLRDAAKVKVNGLAGATAWSQVRRKGREYKVFLAVIHTGPKRFHRLLMADPSFKLQRAFKQWLYSFRRLGRAETGRLKTPKIRIYQVRPGDTVTSIGKNKAAGKNAEALFRLLNAIPNGQALVVGSQVKVISRR